jgi:DNA invertase Pin-like site-specific DNA recombinase
VDDSPGIPCVIYAAKSTEDRRGSIPEQLRECREAIEADPRRRLVAHYKDEKFSAYRRDRGPGLADATQHAEDLAAEHGIAELWAQHSDRIARGDGRRARHTVEIALWALKRDVRVRTVQDPDTFRDLLYAVVTGQRNHEDSRRKGLASAAGRKRAVERGDYAGSKPDGYRVIVEVDESGAVKKRLDIDPARSPVIEMIFAMALQGRRTGEIARAVSDAGWLTKPISKRTPPKAWGVHCVRAVLKNTRYAGLATHKGEVLGRGNWPTYITEREHDRIQAQLVQHPPRSGPRRHEPYILARLATCGSCGGPMHCVTGMAREDGTFARRYVCASHQWWRHAGRCSQQPIDAEVVEPMFASTIRSLLIEGFEQEAELAPATVYTAPAERSTDSPQRQRVLEAVRQGGDEEIDAALDELLTHTSPEAGMLHRIAASSRVARQLETAQRIEAWGRAALRGRTDASRAEARKLGDILRHWFSSVTLQTRAGEIIIVTQRRVRSGAEDSHGRAEARFDRQEWMRWSPATRRKQKIYIAWEDTEILGALQAWADAHGRVPRSRDWFHGGSYFPSSSTVRHRFGDWNAGLIRAGLKPTTPQLRSRWEDEEIVLVLQGWAARHGRPPSMSDWARGASDRPAKTTVLNHFGSWSNALAEAGLA